MTLTPPRSLNRGRSRYGTAAPSRLGVDWRELDWVMLGAVAAIGALGLVMVYSATRNLVDDPYYFVKRQAVAMVLGVAAFLMILSIDYRKFRDYSLLAYVMVLVLLFGVVTPFGSSANRSRFAQTSALS